MPYSMTSDRARLSAKLLVDIVGKIDLFFVQVCLSKRIEENNTKLMPDSRIHLSGAQTV